MSDTIATGGAVSDEETKMDELIQSSSTPTLATLFQQGKQAGLIKPAIDYGHTV